MGLKDKINRKINNYLQRSFREFEKKKTKDREAYYRRKYNLADSFSFGRIEDIYLSGDHIEIGENTYFNSGNIQSGSTSKVKIGEWCAIGYNVTILARTHDIEKPTGPPAERKKIEKNITIGDHCWIGTNVFIKEGVTLGNNVIIGANSVVTKSFEDGAIIGGIPAKLIRYKA